MFEPVRISVATPSRGRGACFLVAYLILFLCSSLAAQSAPIQEIVFRSGLGLNRTSRAARSPVHVDPVEEAIVRGTWKPPVAGDSVEGMNGNKVTWMEASAKEDGTFTNSAMRGGYFYTTIDLEESEIRLLEASGHNLVYVNGTPRPGDPYSTGYLQLPVALRKGRNEFLFQTGRGQLRAKVVTPRAAQQLSFGDLTLPDVVRGSTEDLWGAIVVLNCSEDSVKDLAIRTLSVDGSSVETSLPSIPPLTLRKVPFKIVPPKTLETNSTEITVELFRSGTNGILDKGKFTLRIRNPEEQYKLTFTSQIDGSLQYYAVTPALNQPGAQPPRALFLSTHGASVEAIGQAQAYAPKSWGYLAAPTNRRPYGFDWEEWGRMDALEVLELARTRFKTDPAQTYLTGHSMGGHGAWQLGVTFPDKFGAVAPSAGWISFRSYAGATRTAGSNAVERLLDRAATPSETLTLASNYLHHGIYVLHGDADDNVPVTEARKMKERLSEFHRDFMYHEQPGAGHWWGNACVDWPPIFEFFARHKIPEDRSVTHVQFATANPGISASSHWLTIETQEKSLARSAIDIRYDAGPRKFIGTTENTALISLDLTKLGITTPAGVELDGQNVEIKSDANLTKLWLARVDGSWKETQAPDKTSKGPHRNGPFKEAFRHRMIFVYGTAGTPEENAWSYAKARFDAETWYYRGNGAVDMIPDREFSASPDHNRGVVLYGNADNNSAWNVLLNDSPVKVRRDYVQVGDRVFKGDDLACIFCRPNTNSDQTMVAVVAGTGLAGLRLTERLPYFTSGVAYPDCTVFAAETLKTGADGIRVCGFFGNDWSLQKGEFEWKEQKPEAQPEK